MPPGESDLVSILIVNYRAYTELASCLESLRRFRADDLEVIVVDHASDPTATTHLLQRFPWIRLLAVTSNPGFAAGVNRAVRVSRGKNLLLLNPDCIVHGDLAHALAAWLDEHPHVGVWSLIRTGARFERKERKQRANHRLDARVDRFQVRETSDFRRKRRFVRIVDAREVA